MIEVNEFDLDFKVSNQLVNTKATRKEKLHKRVAI